MSKMDLLCATYLYGAEADSFLELRKARDTELKVIELISLLKFLAQVDSEVICCDLGWYM